MKRILLAPAVLALLATATAFVPPTQDPQDGEDTQLALHMKDLNTTLRKLRGALRDPANNAESLVEIRRLQGVLLTSRIEKPLMIGQTPEAERAEFLVEFQKQMVELHRAMLDLELRVLESDNDAAQAQLKTINSMKSDAHKIFKVKD